MHQRKCYTAILPLLAFFSLLACSPRPVSSALQDFLDQHPELRPKYVYQSILRVVNADRNPEFEKLIRDIHCVTVYLPSEADSTFSLASLRPVLQADGYEILLEARTANLQRISLWVKTANGDEFYLALVESPGKDVILKLEGRLAIEYLPSLTEANQAALQRLMTGQ